MLGIHFSGWKSLDFWIRKEGNVLFNDTLNTFYLWLYGVRHMVKYHTDSERENPVPSLHGLLFPINSNSYFICTIPQTGLHIPRPLLHQSWSTGFLDKMQTCTICLGFCFFFLFFSFLFLHVYMGCS